MVNITVTVAVDQSQHPPSNTQNSGGDHLTASVIGAELGRVQLKTATTRGAKSFRDRGDRETGTARGLET